MASVADIVRQARSDAGLTQAELAERAATSQSAIARLESGGANPRLSTLEDVLAATGHELAIAASAENSGIDETQIAANLRLSPAERLDRFQSAHENTRKLVAAARTRKR
jgi:transcriptional regulator with XRE-family HTH domain